MVVHKLRKFCPECCGTSIRRVHRGFLKKHILRQKPKYKCSACQVIFFAPLLEKDLKKAPEDLLKISTSKQTEYEEIEIVVEKP